MLEIICLVAVGYTLHLVVSNYGELREIRGVVDTLKNAPVLRQYIERYVPVDNSKEAQSKIQENMEKMAQEWNGMFGFGSTKSTAEQKRAEKDFNEFQKRSNSEDLV